MKKLKHYFLLLLAVAFPLLLPTIAFADLNLSPNTTDLSLQYLSNIFGVVGNVLHGTGTQIFGHMFNIFNSAVLALGGIIITYTLFVSTLNTAGEGEIMGKKWSSIWIPLRSAAGIGLLLPKGTGYSAIQVFVMWVVVQGIGAADSVWNTAVDYLASGGVIIQQNVAATSVVANPTLMNNISQLFQNEVCYFMVEKSLNNTPQPGSSSPSPIATGPSTKIPSFQSLLSQQLSAQTVDLDSTGITMTVNFPPKNSAYADNLVGVCGSVQFTTGDMRDYNHAVWAGLTDILTSNMESQAQLVADTYYTSNSNEFINFLSADLFQGNIDLFLNAADDFIGITYAAFNSNNVASQNPQNAEKAYQIIQKSKAQGWLMAGKYYFDLATANNNAGNYSINSSMFNIAAPTAAGQNSVASLFPDVSLVLQNQVFLRYLAQAKQFDLGNSGHKGKGSGNPVNKENYYEGVNAGVGALGTVTGIFVPGLGPLLGGISDLATSFDALHHSQQDNLNPILSLAVMGDGMMGVAMGIFMMGIWASFGAAFTLGLIPCGSESSAITSVVAWVIPFLTAIMIALFTAGAVLAFYIPLVPFILFTFGGIGWLVLVIEAMLAAPMVAIGIAYPEGHEIWGRADPAIMLLVNVFIRPTLMIFGYIAGISLSYVGIWIFNRGFNYAFNTAATATYNQAGQGWNQAALFAQGIGAIFVLVTYAGVCLAVVNKAFTLIYVVPDRVLRWVGGNLEGSGDVKEAEGAVRGSAEKGASTGGQGVGGGSEAAMSRGKAAQDKKEQQKQQQQDKKTEAGIDTDKDVEAGGKDDSGAVDKATGDDKT